MISIIKRDHFEICTSETDDSLPLRPNWILLRELRFSLSTSRALQRRSRVSDNDNKTSRRITTCDWGEEKKQQEMKKKKTRATRQKRRAEKTLLVWTRNKTRNTIVTYAFRLRTHHVHSSINSLMPGGHISATLSVWTSLFRRSLLLPVHSLLSGLVKSKNTMLLGSIKGFLFPILWDRWTGEHAQESQFFIYFGSNLWSSQNGNDP